MSLSRPTRKIFILNGKSTGPRSTADIKTMLETHSIFDSSVDVTLTDFAFNTDQLNKGSRPLSVVPGGKAIYMANALTDEAQKTLTTLTTYGDYLGVCAGGYWGTSTSVLLKTDYSFITENGFVPPEYHSTRKFLPGVCTDFQAVGPFQPTTDYATRVLGYSDVSPVTKEELESWALKPYCVNLRTNNHSLPQLYADGCTFKQLNHNTEYAILASYPGNLAYHGKVTDSLQSLPAIIAKRATADRPGVFLTGVHIECCVQDSKLLPFFKTKSSETLALTSKDYETLEKAPESNCEFVVKALKSTFNVT